MEIEFFFESELPPIDLLSQRKNWIQAIIEKHNYQLGGLNYIIGDDEYIRNINVEYLSHNYYTDIITFDMSEEENIIEGDIFVSLTRVTDNANQLNTPVKDELDRVLIHGVLHLMGWSDKSENDSEEMRRKEEECLSLRPY